MLFKRYVGQLSKHVEAAFAGLVKKKKIDADPRAVAADLQRLNLRVDMSKSAARLRRQFIALGKDGWEPRMEDAGPVILGDVYLDQFKLVRLCRSFRAPEGERESPALALEVLQAYLDAISKAMQGGLKYPSQADVGVLLSLHLSETAHKVKKETVHRNVARHFGQWKIPEPGPADVDDALRRLLQYGFIKDEDEKSWRLVEEVAWQF